MQITRRSMLSGITRTKEIDVTRDQLEEWANGGLIQDVMPNLSDDDREFILSGITADEWDSVYGEEEEIC